METASSIDFDAYYSVEGFEGVAFVLLGHVKVFDEDYDWTGIAEDDPQWVRAVMVGDNCVYEIDVDDLREIEREDFCGQCGQIGCEHDGLERE